MEQMCENEREGFKRGEQIIKEVTRRKETLSEIEFEHHNFSSWP